MDTNSELEAAARELAAACSAAENGPLSNRRLLLGLLRLVGDLGRQLTGKAPLVTFKDTEGQTFELIAAGASVDVKWLTEAELRAYWQEQIDRLGGLPFSGVAGGGMADPLL